MMNIGVLGRRRIDTLAVAYSMEKKRIDNSFLQDVVPCNLPFCPFVSLVNRTANTLRVLSGLSMYVIGRG